MRAARRNGVVIYAIFTLSGWRPLRARALLSMNTPMERIAVYLVQRAKFNRLEGWHNAVR